MRRRSLLNDEKLEWVKLGTSSNYTSSTRKHRAIISPNHPIYGVAFDASQLSTLTRYSIYIDFTETPVLASNYYVTSANTYDHCPQATTNVSRSGGFSINAYNKWVRSRTDSTNIVSYSNNATIETVDGVKTLCLVPFSGVLYNTQVQICVNNISLIYVLLDKTTPRVAFNWSTAKSGSQA